MTIETVVVLVLVGAVVVALVTDLKDGKIYNWLTLPLWVSGLVFSYTQGGLSALGEAFGAGLMIAVVSFLFSTPGGGDIKLGFAVGAWIGTAGYMYYFIGMGITRVLSSLAVKFKAYGGMKGFLGGLKYELVTGRVMPEGDKNFVVFQNAAKKVGYKDNLPVVPGAIWVAGGVFYYAVNILF